MESRLPYMLGLVVQLLPFLWQGISETFSCKYRYGIYDCSHNYDYICIFYDRSQIHIGTILYQIVYSFCVDLFANIHVYSAHLWVNALIMLLGIILFAMGTGNLCGSFFRAWFL